MPSAEVNSVMISPHPPRLRMKRRNTVSVTPAMGASTVAGAMRTFPMVSEEGTGVVLAGVVSACVARAPSPASGPELSQYLRTSPFYLVLKRQSPAKAGLELAERSSAWTGQRPVPTRSARPTGLQPPESAFDF